MARQRNIFAVAALAALAIGIGTSTPAVAGGTRMRIMSRTDGVKLPMGYSIDSVNGTATAGEQSEQVVNCPGKDVPFGGGVYVTSTDVNVNVNTSRPLITGNGWAAAVNNASPVDSGMTTYAICAKKPNKYQVVQRSVDNVSDGSFHKAVSCPPDTVILGGGSDSSSFNLENNIESSDAAVQGWFSAQFGPDQFTLTTYAICAEKPTGYKLVAGGNATDPLGTQAHETVPCPGHSVPLSGWVVSDDTGIFVATTYPSGPQAWEVYYNNPADSVSDGFSPGVICAT